MKNSSKLERLPPLIVVIVGVILSLLALVAGTYDPLWSWLGVTNGNLRGSLTLTFSLFFLLVSFLLAHYQKLDEIATSVQNFTDGLNKRLKQELPHIQVLRAILADAALKEIAASLGDARVVRNTRILGDKLRGGYQSEEGREYARIFEKRLIRGGMIAYDVINTSWQDYARDLLAKVPDQHYRCYVVANSLPSFLNFIVLEYADGERDVYFGWAISPTRGFEQVCFHTTENRVVSFFAD
jgi:ABC-type multidrug transport system fused ATPase/permease subunit